MLAVLVLASFSSFSQNVTLSEKQAKAVAKDLIAGEACAQELEQTQNILELTETKLRLKEEVVLNLESQKSELQKKDLLRMEQISSKEKIIQNVEKQVRNVNRKTTFYKIAAVAGILSTGYLLIR